ncbi:MAG: hypothetical protein JSV26_08955, partial [bacterium]
AGTGQIALTWTNPTDADLAEILVLRTIGDYAADHSAPGTVIYSGGVEESATDTTAQENTTYYYAAFTRDDAPTPNWNDAVTQGTTADSAAWNNDPVISGIAQAPSDTNVLITWSTDEPATSEVAYAEGTTLTGAAVVSDPALTTDHTVAIGGLDPGTLYSYRVTSADEHDNSSSSARVQFTTSNVTEPGAVTDFDATDDEVGQITLTWTNPTDVDLNWYMIRRAIDPASPGSLTDGTLVVQTAAAPGDTESYVDTAVTEGTVYNYVIFTRDDNGNWNVTVGPGNTDAGTYPDTLPTQVTALTATDDEIGQVTVTWNNPTDPDLAEVLVLRTENDYAANHGATGAYAAYSGTGTSVVDTTVNEGVTYYYAAFTRDTADNWEDTVNTAPGGNADTGIYPDTPPAQVTDFAATDDEIDQVTLTWTNPADDDLMEHMIRRDVGTAAPADTTDGTLLRRAIAAPASAGSYVDDTVLEGVTYAYAVFTRDGSGNWNEDVTSGLNADTGIFPNTIPGTVTNFTAAAGTGQIALAWTNPDDDDLAEVLILRRTNNFPPDHDGPGIPVYSGLAETFIDTTANENQNNYYAAFTRDDAPTPNWNDTMTPGTTAALATWNNAPVISSLAAAPGDTSVVITWTTDEPATSDVAYAEGNTLTSATVIPDPALTTDHSVTISGLDPGILYSYRVTSADIFDNSTSSARNEFTTANATPPGPATGFNATDNQTGQVTLTWTNPDDVDLNWYMIRKAVAFTPQGISGGTEVHEDTAASGQTDSWIDTDVVEGTIYNYVIFTRDSGGNWNTTVNTDPGGNTDEGGYPTTLPNQVTGLTASDDTVGQVSIDWTNPTDPDLAEVLVLRTQGTYATSHTTSPAVTVYQGLGTSVVDNNNVIEGITYYYVAFPRDTANNWEDTVNTDPGGNADTGIYPNTPPGRVTNFTATAGTAQIALSWTNPPDTDFQVYTIRRDVGTTPQNLTDGEELTQAVAAPGSSLIFVDNSPDEGTTYHYVIFTRDLSNNWNTTVDDGNSEIGAWNNAPVISSLAHTLSDTTALITWETNEAATSLVEYGLDSGYGNTLGRVGLYWSHSMLLTGLTPDSEYHYRVTSEDAVGNSTSTTADLTFTTTNTDPPALITDLSAVMENETPKVVLTWTNPADGDLSDIRVKRRRDDYPAGHDDPLAATVYSSNAVTPGMGMTVEDLNVQRGEVYFYAVFSADNVSNWQDGITVNLNAVTNELPEPGGGSVGGCFIATAAYGSYEAPYVKLLRQFRDRYLLTNSPGRWFVDQYYTHSPRYAQWLSRHENARKVVRVLLIPLIAVAWLLLNVGVEGKLILLVFALLFTGGLACRLASARTGRSSRSGGRC